MDIITQMTEEMTAKALQLDIGKGIGQFMDEAYAEFKTYILGLARYKLAVADLAILNHKSLRKQWQVCKANVSRTIQTQFGALTFGRRYYTHKQVEGKRCYLLDEYLHIPAYERVDNFLKAKVCALATEYSYEKSSQLACEGAITRQSVKRIVQQAKEPELVPVRQRTQVKVIHIQADEDHVALQDGRRSTIVKLAVIHEPPEREETKRIFLPQRFILNSYNETTEDFWLRIADAISARYGDRDDLRIYIHGDGASWIRQGVEWLPNSVFVLDRYHLQRYLLPLCGGEDSYAKLLWSYIKKGQLKQLTDVVAALVDTEVCQKETAQRFLTYVRGNWDGIQVYYDPRHAADKSCAEGLVSHILSERLSSRPKGWLDAGLDAVSSLRVYRLNGGEIKPDFFTKTRHKLRKMPQQIRAATQTKRAYIPGPSSALKTPHRSSAYYRLYKSITEGGAHF